MTPSEEGVRPPRRRDPNRGLRRFEHVSDAIVLGAVERAQRHKRRPGSQATMTSIAVHLGFLPNAWTTRNVRPQLERLTADGALTGTRAHSVLAWQITAQGRKRLSRLRRGGELPMPEAPQHRAWRYAHEEAAQRIEEFRDLLHDALEQAEDLILAPRSESESWLSLSQRLQQTCWQLGSATYCLHEWHEPDDAHADEEDFSTGDPRKGRRNPRNWQDADELDELAWWRAT